ncbi:MAG TPA: hypothetical protein PKX79_06195 [Spirochaetota bacterium]|nr:hypothetical protein [Spirochaetota bacterium]HRS63594.1 hypothetical protein [Spirochaetota bacterium]
MKAIIEPSGFSGIYMISIEEPFFISEIVLSLALKEVLVNLKMLFSPSLSLKKLMSK